jgi:hypothetical protein
MRASVLAQFVGQFVPTLQSRIPKLPELSSPGGQADARAFYREDDLHEISQARIGDYLRALMPSYIVHAGAKSSRERK